MSVMHNFSLREREACLYCLRLVIRVFGGEMGRGAFHRIFLRLLLNTSIGGTSSRACDYWGRISVDVEVGFSDHFPMLIGRLR